MYSVSGIWYFDWFQVHVVCAICGDFMKYLGNEVKKKYEHKIYHIIMYINLAQTMCFGSSSVLQYLFMPKETLLW